MTVDVIGHKEYRDAIRSYVLIGVCAIAALFGIVGNALYIRADDVGTVEGLITSLSGVGFVVPLIAIVLGYKAISGERESGSINLMLSLPHTRKEVFFGKFLGRLAILLTALAVLFSIGLVLSLVDFGLGGLATYVAYVLSVAVFATVYLALALGLSGAIGSSTVAGGISIGLFFVFRFAWSFIAGSLVSAAEWLGADYTTEPLWFELFLFLNPHNAFRVVQTELVFDGQLQAFSFAAMLLLESDTSLINEWTGLMLLLLWIAVPLAIGYIVFDGTDL